MKKYITVAALLAAGTAFANADITLLDTVFTDYASLDEAKADGWSQTTRNGRGDALVISSEYGLQCPGWKQSTFEHALSSEIDLDSDGSYTATFEALKTANDVTLQFALASDSYSLVVGTSYNSNPGVYVGTADTNVLTSSAFYTFQTGNTASNFNTVQIPTLATVSSTALENNVFLTYSLKLETSADGDDSLVVSVSNGDTQVATTTYSFDGTGAFSSAGFMLEGGGTAVSFKNVSVTAVPEPSAFGLLAGLGALALVASRRRRNRR